MIRALVILALGFSVSACLAGPPPLTVTEEIIVAFEPHLVDRVVDADGSVSVWFADGETATLFNPFSYHDRLCDRNGCISVQAISSVGLPRDRINVEAGPLIIGSVVGYAVLGAAGLALTSEREAQSGEGTWISAQPIDWRAERQVLICGSPDEYPRFEGETDRDAAEWVYQNRQLLASDCLRLVRELILAGHLSQRQEVELHHLTMLRTMWERARCERVAFVTDQYVRGFANPFHQNAPIGAALGRSDSERDASWSRFAALRLEGWVYEYDFDLQETCSAAGGVASRDLWGVRKGQILRADVMRRSDPILYDGARRLEADAEACSGASFSQQGACWTNQIERSGASSSTETEAT